MSIYTITLKRELLGANSTPTPTSSRLAPDSVSDSSNQQLRQQQEQQRANWLTPDSEAADESHREEAGEAHAYNRKEAQEANESSAREKLKNNSDLDLVLQAADWLDCICGLRPTIGTEDKENIRQQVQSHSADCLKARLKQQLLLQEEANKIVHSVNVSLEVTADLKRPNHIVWYKNNRQLTSSEKPILYQRVARSSGGKKAAKQQTSTSSSIRRTRSKKSIKAQGYEIEETVEDSYFVERLEESQNRESAESTGDSSGKNLDEEILVAKCQQESSEKGSKLTIFNLQDEDYGQYTCKLIDTQGGQQLNIHTQLKQDQEADSSRASSRYKSRLVKLNEIMDEVIEVKEGDLNIELGIQILPETNEDEELMSEEEKAEFVENTTITWFKDDVKLDKNDPQVKKLFQFTYDQNEGYHRLIVLKATKETEGVYTCLVENESGTSSCSTQLVVGPGNKPKLTSRLQDVTVYVGQSLEFRIKSTGLPPIDSCQWFKDDELLIELDTRASSRSSCKSSTNERVTIIREVDESVSTRSGKEEDKVIIFRLCIENLKLDDTGRYRCRINNEYGYDESDCFVKVLQEIIEEHEEVEETIEETTRLGGGKKSTREEEEEEIEERQVVEETTNEELRSTKRQKQEEDIEMRSDDGGRAPVFVRKLEDQIVSIEEETTVIASELVVSTKRDEWSNSEEQLKVRWFVDDVEIERRDSEHQIENFYDETSSEWLHRLRIRSSSKESRRYTCRASNKFGQSETSCQIRRLKKPRFLRSLEDTETHVGETLVMKVTLDESDESCQLDELKFLRDGKQVYSSKDKTSSSSTTSSKSRIRVTSYEETIEEEETVTTTTRYSRRRSSGSMTRKRKGRTYEMTIENVQVDQMGGWECEATNEAGSSTCKAEVEVFAEPKIVTDLPEQVRVPPSKEIRLTVEASGSPIPVYSWFKDGIGIAEEEDRVFTQTKSTTTKTTTTTMRRRSSVTSMRNEDGIDISGETLIIKDARPEDAGVYTCKVENRLGQVETRPAKLTVIGHGDDRRGAPRIIKDFSLDQVIETDEGETVLLKVLAEGQPRPKQIWYKDTEEIIERVTRYEVENEGQEYKLKIKRSTIEDSGKYKVILRNELGETSSRTVEIKVNKITRDRESQRRPSAPSIMLDAQDKVVGLGSNISFDVQVGGHPKPLITWYKNGRRLTESGDGRVSFVEEETTTTITEEEEDIRTGAKRTTSRKETSTIHKLVITNVRETDEAIYSLKADNDLGSTKSSLVSLTVDKRKESVDELAQSKRIREEEAASRQEEQQEEEEEVTTTTTVTQTTKTTRTKDEVDDVVDESESRKSRRTSASIRSEEDQEEEDDDSTVDGKRRKTTRTTRTTTKTTTTTTEEEDEEARRESERIEQEEAEEESKREKSKRKTLVEEETAEDIEEEARSRRKTRVVDEEQTTREDETITKREQRDEQMDVDEQEDSSETRSRRTSEKSKRRQVAQDERIDEDEEIDIKSPRTKRDSESTITKRRESRSQAEEKARRLIETEEKTETSETYEVTRSGPRVVSAPKKVVAGLGSSPEIEIEVEVETETTTKDEEKITWLKDDEEIPSRLLRDNHIEIIEKSTSQPGIKKHVLRINSLRSSDAADYKLKVETPKGVVETEPIEVQVDRTMRSGERPVVTPAEIQQPTEGKPIGGTGKPSEPEVVHVPEEIVAGIGSSPVIEAEIKGLPKPETTWFRDGQPIGPEELAKGHLEVIETPTERPDVTKQALKINDLKPADVAAYHIKAENPLGEVESEPTNLRIDRSMGPRDEPKITEQPRPDIGEAVPMDVGEDEGPSEGKAAPKIVDAPQKVVAPLGSSPSLVVEISGEPKPEVSWLKDGKLVVDQRGHIALIESPEGTHKLCVTNLKAIDQGDYTLKATNEAGEVESAPIALVVDAKMSPHDEPRVVKEDYPEADLEKGHDLAKDKRGSESLAPVAPTIDDEGEADYKSPDVRRDSETPRSKRRESRPEAEEKAKRLVEPEEIATGETSDVSRAGPRIVSAPKRIVAGLGSTPDMEVVVETATSPVGDEKITWLKDDQEIPARLLRDNHIEIIEKSTSQPGIKKHVLRINSLRSSDAADYKLKVETPKGVVETEPIEVQVDRSMRSGEKPVVTPAEIQQPTEGRPIGGAGKPSEPEVVHVPEEIVAGIGSSPVIEAEIKGLPKPETTWFRDGQPIGPEELAKGHLEVIETPTERPDVTKQALKINDLKPADVAAYHIKAENPLGEVESEPTNLRVDRSMGPRDEPKITEQPRPETSEDVPMDIGDGEDERPSEGRVAPRIVDAPQKVVAPLGSSPNLVVEVSGEPKPEVSWLKDGKLVTDQRGHIALVESPDGTHKLCVTNLKAIDQGDYTLVATNDAGEAQSSPIALVVDTKMSPRDEPRVVKDDSAYQIPSDDRVAPKGADAAEELDTPLDLAPRGAMKASPEKTMSGAEDGAESEPTDARLGRSMEPDDEPVGAKAKIPFSPEETAVGSDLPTQAPKILHIPHKIVAPLGSNPTIEAEVSGEPMPEVTWLKDGRRVSDQRGHIALVESPDGKHKLCVTNLKAIDQGDYTLKATNEAGEVESAPIALIVDSKMSPRDEPRVVEADDADVDSVRRPSRVSVGDRPGDERAKAPTDEDEDADRGLPGTERRQSRPQDEAKAKRMTEPEREAETGDTDDVSRAGPRIVSAPKRIVAGLGSTPDMEVVVETATSPVGDEKITWLKDDQEIPARLLRDNHIEIIEKSTSQPGIKKHVLRINSLRSSDAADYKLKVETPKGVVETEPIEVQVDRSMRSGEKPVVTPAEIQQPTEGRPIGGTGKPSEPEVVHVPEEIVAGIGSSPVIEAEIKGLPKPETTWFRDGQPIGPEELAKGHLEVIESPTERPDVTKQALKINDLKPGDVAAYHIKAENPLGEVESAPTNLRIDRSMGPRDEPKITEQPRVETSETVPMDVGEDGAPSGRSVAPRIVDAPTKVVAPLGSSPSLVVEVSGEPKPEVTWLKDGRRVSDQRGHIALVESPDGTHKLCVTNLKAIDQGDYTLVATNDAGEAQSSPIALVVDTKMSPRDEPRVVKDDDTSGKAKSVDAPDEQDASMDSGPLHEVGFGDGPEAAVSRTKDGAASEPADARIGGSMGPEDEPAAAETKIPFSPEEAAESSKSRAQAPTIRHIPRKIVAPLGSNPTIEVEVSGEPKPEVIWYKDGKQVTDQRGHIALIEMPDGTHKLSVTNLKAIDQGDYTLKATNEAGEVESAPISLIVDTTMSPRDEPRVVEADDEDAVSGPQVSEAQLRGFAPKISRVSEKVVAALGADAVVEIDVKAQPQASVSWFKDNEAIPSRLLDEGHVRVEETKLDDDTTRYTLAIGPLKPSDSGVYRIEAENPLGSCKSPSVGVTLRKSSVAEGKPKRNLRAPTIKRVPRQIVAAEGSSPVLEVEVSGEPVPEIVWFKNGKRIEKSDAHYSMDYSPETGVCRLTVHKVVAKGDAGVYTVVATNEAGTAESGPIDLKVTAGSAVPSGDDESGFAPQVVRITDEVVAGVGSTPKMELEIKASPKAEVTWFKDGQPLDVQDSSKFEVEETRIDQDTTLYTLKIHNLKPMDVAAYHARAENPFGSVESMPINLRIDRSMDADSAPIVTTSETPFVPEEDKPKRRLRAPVIKRMPRKIVAGVGSNPIIEIEVSGEPKPEIVWYKNGRRVTEIKNHIAIEETPDGKYRLCFTNLKATDQAEYTITATNEAGQVESGPISLIVDRMMGKNQEPLVQEATDLPVDMSEVDGKPVEAPQILGLENQEALPGQTVKLEAEVLGHPKPDIKWLKDGDEVELNIINEVPDSNVHSLTLKNVNDLYDGVYSLEARNIAGVVKKDAAVKIVDELTTAKPEPIEETRKPRDVEAPKRKEPEERESREKPFIKKGLKFSQVNQGRSIKFEVQIDGKYDELIWTKDGEQINVPFTVEEGEVAMDDGDDTSTLRGESPVGDELLTGDDLVSGKPKRRFAPRILARPRNVVTGPGSRVCFEVKCEGEPKPEVHWFKNGERVATTTSDGKIFIEEFGENGSRLVIEDVQETDVAEYYAVAENSYGSERTQPATLEIDEEMLASDDLANTSADYQQTPSSLHEPDGPLKRGRAPRILSRPKPVHAGVGSKVFFEVQVSGEPEPIVNWFRDGRIIKQTSDGHVTIEEYSNGCVRLVLSDITDSDVGQYHVVAENKLGSERTIPVSLTIDETAEATDTVEEFVEICKLDDQEQRRRRGGRAPRILLRPRHLKAPLGGEAVLEVSVVGQSKPSIIWHKNGKRITSSSDGRIRIEEISEGYQRLVISNLNQSDTGSYTVSAENDFGVAMSQPAELVVEETTTTTTETTTTTSESFFERYVSDGSETTALGPSGKRAPRFTIKPRNKKAPIGSKVDFEVKVTGEPKPDIVWYKNGRRIHTTSDGRVRVEEFSDGGSKLVIEDLEETDHGVYAAEARNEMGTARTDDVQLRVTQRTEVSEKVERTQRGSARVTTKTKKTRSHYTFSEERHGYVTLTINDAQMDHDGDYKLVVRNKWGEASTQAPLVVIPKVEPRSSYGHSQSAYDGDSSLDGRDSRARRTPFDELEDYGHELDRSIGIYGSESHYQSGEDTYLLQLRDTEFPLRLRKYLRFGARQSPSLRSNLMDAHWGAGARVTIRERRKFREVMDEEIDDEKRGLDTRPTPMRLQKEVGTCGYAAAQLEHLRVEAAERVARNSAEPGAAPVDMMPPFFREKLKDAVIEESGSGQQEAVFACMATGEPKPDYTWFRNDILITPDVNRMLIIAREDGGSELHIRDPRLHDAGCFKCVAGNVHGSVTARARLRVASRPSRPEPPEYVSVTSREVFLQWRPPRDYDTNVADVLGYKLEMSQSSIGQEDNWSILAADIGHEFYVVDDLTPATSYSFRLSARNKFGWSDSSYSTYVTTCRSDDANAATRLAVPHEMRSRQFTSDIVDPHVLRQCEDEKRPEMDYGLELNPVKLVAADAGRWSDDYSLQTEIARGRFSVVSKACAKNSDGPHQQVAIKAVLLESMSAAQTKNEFDILRSLQHEKVVRLLVAYKDEDMFVLVMERLSGIDVLTYLSSFTSYSEELVSKIITQVMDAIEYLHFRGMCLLELLPDNVVMTNGRTASLKLVDFSAARFVPRSGARVPMNTSQSVEYCPPEVIAGHEVSTASDVWCIGVLTYVLLSGFSPFKGESEDETRENVRLGRYKYDHIYGNCTPEVTRFLINVFKKHSSKRPTIEQLYENKWLLPNEFMIRKRQHAVFKTDKIVAFAEEFHKSKSGADIQCPQRLIDLLASSGGQ